MQTLLSLKHIQCQFDDRIVVDDLSLHINEGNLICLLGPSGCGKTTVLRAIAGFHALNAGEIRIRDQIVSSVSYSVPPEKRHLGMVFQDYALFPHLNLRDNIAFGLQSTTKVKSRQIVGEMLELVGLQGLEKRFPHELSGGQQQRVALARALAPKPDLVLMDEPFSNLDVDMRERLSEEVHGILKHHGATAILVTHDQHEAFALGEQIGVMHEGRLLQWDTPYNLYHEPNCHFVADFIGQGVFLPGTLLAPDTVETAIGTHKGNRGYSWDKGTEVGVLLRPDDIVPDKNSALKGKIIKKAFKGAEILYTLRIPSGHEILSLFPSHLDYGLGETVGIRVEADHLVAFSDIK